MILYAHASTREAQTNTFKRTRPENNPLSRPLQSIVLREDYFKSKDRALQRAIDSYEAAQPSPKQKN